ncbi:hypothetical protein BC828DRAFT_400700, partial [Blastocladiella britannica]
MLTLARRIPWPALCRRNGGVRAMPAAIARPAALAREPPNEEELLRASAHFEIEHRTPLSKQILHFYAAYGYDHVLLIRVGAFYEMYGLQSEQWGSGLNLIASRKGVRGFPVVALHTYISRLVHDLGCSVAVLDQVSNSYGLSDEQQATVRTMGSGKGEARYLSRVYTPGTFQSTESGDPILLASIHLAEAHTPAALGPSSQVELACYDATSTRCEISTLAISGLKQALYAAGPTEILCPAALLGVPTRIVEGGTSKPLSAFFPPAARVVGRPQSDFLEATHSLDGDLVRQGAAPVPPSLEARPTRHAVMAYLSACYVGNPPQLGLAATNRRAIVSHETAEHLELFRTAYRDSTVGSVMSLVDKTATAFGKAALHSAFSSPLMNVAEIQRRQNAVMQLIPQSALHQHLLKFLTSIARVRAVNDMCKAVEARNADFSTLRTIYVITALYSDFISNIDGASLLATSSPAQMASLSKVLEIINAEFDFASHDLEKLRTLDENLIMPIGDDLSLQYYELLARQKELLETAKDVQAQFYQESGLPPRKALIFRDGVFKTKPRNTEHAAKIGVDATIQMTPQMH